MVMSRVQSTGPIQRFRYIKRGMLTEDWACAPHDGEHEQEEDGCWLAAGPELPGVLAYGATAEEAMAKAEVLALRVIAERLGYH